MISLNDKSCAVAPESGEYPIELWTDDAAIREFGARLIFEIKNLALWTMR